MVSLPLQLTTGKRYTLTVSNDISGKGPDGRDESSVLYEYNFGASHGGMRKKILWYEFKPVYRGKPKEDAPELDLAKIRRWSFMIRSFFDEQDGEFDLSIRSIFAYKEKAESTGEQDKEGVEAVSVMKSASRSAQ